MENINIKTQNLKIKHTHEYQLDYIKSFPDYNLEFFKCMAEGRCLKRRESKLIPKNRICRKCHHIDDWIYTDKQGLFECMNCNNKQK